MCLINFDECDCSCHKGFGSVHMVACCETCPNCGSNIKPFAFERHVKECGHERSEANTGTEAA